MEFGIVELSRLQFAMTAMYHFLFVPLTLGLSILVAIMETVYVMTNRPIWRQMTKFWGTLFGINFVLGVATGITMEFQFGMNWSYYSHYVGDIFGAPLAMEGLAAFFVESTFLGLWLFGWDKLSKVAHLTVAWLVALGSNFSALWILIANGWMQNPVGAEFSFETMRMEMTDFWAVLFNPVAQAKFVHTVSAGYVTAAVFVIGVSAWYLLKGRHIELARRSITVAAAFGLASAFSVVLLGDESGYNATHSQKMIGVGLHQWLYYWDWPFAAIPLLIGFLAGLRARRGAMRSLFGAALSGLVLAALASLLDLVLRYFLYGDTSYDAMEAVYFLAGGAAAGVLAWLVARALPRGWLARLPLGKRVR